LYKLFAESETQVGVYSTAVYEGLAFDLDTYILDAPGSSRMEHLIEQGAASQVSSVEEFERILGEGESKFDVDYFFESNPIENISDAFDYILEKEN
jgi:hypothetical protein